MRCDLHVHTRHSGMCGIPLLRMVCRESYTRPEDAYRRLRARGMDLVTITDHDSIEAAEHLRELPDFFLSEEVTCRMPSGTELHVGVYDITERQHFAIQRRRADLAALTAYCREERIFFSANHIFSGLTGARQPDDFDWMEAAFPAFETLNGHILPPGNRQAALLAGRLGKSGVGGSDSHSLHSLGTAYTEVAEARSKEEFLAGLRMGRGVVHGQSGSYRKLTAEVIRIAWEMMRENIPLAPCFPLAIGIPAVTLTNFVLELAFAYRWRTRALRTPEDGAAILPPRISQEPVT